MHSPLESWLDYIQKLHPVKWDLGLERVAQVSAILGVEHPGAQVIVVAGTNGKGTTCEYLQAMALAAGKKVGLTTSPHLITYNERIRINGVSVADAQIVAAFETIEASRGSTSLSYFEFSALAAMLIFSEAAVDIAILEVGLGGRLDAMNIVTPDLCVITQIALDHQDYLGETKQEIGLEKAGILRSGVPLVLLDRPATQSILVEAERQAAPVSQLGDEFGYRSGQYWCLDSDGENVVYSVEHMGWLPSASVAGALQAAHLGGFAPDKPRFDEVLNHTRLAGRMQQIQWHGRHLILDVAHNPSAAEFLYQQISQIPNRERVLAVVGMYADKDFSAVLNVMNGVIDAWYLAETDESRSASSTVLKKALAEEMQPVARCYAKVVSAFEAAFEASGPGTIILVFGSFPVVGTVLDLLEVEPF
ncbi:MAG: bifunctional tetrahydrofolate synthase/dihydrofolate synthase [Gammaproteobacteria bacterium]|jgi:dihydrofolate synthase / folylpolyglutamate synthase|nr:bifunctional tetrahydrofolate synthase/dihydrofolate synthase [Gammaproteobacteria bacterium]MBT5201915.1 bifunctional tetrahydrofolate synthase/dihydrofolate synthase [Gammaproteobacteria bacterium]MBT5602432.1 bifunctional tetrahydrofolate synthase/dihydrofolate synthase [Gammaproteobacteria bacterium]MBT6245220.1 bifunctional tetrahydrofolate synthase/dihydrofolate synthase [Gammaproteobacteria bacterium]